jgi:hypothetical protein
MLKRVIRFTICIIIAACSNDQDKPAYSYEDDILVRIGAKTIGVNEFIRRAEYTIRPAWCHDSNPIHKKIVLNSLIAEKLLAMELNENNRLIVNDKFQKYLKGRKEQAMRQWLYQKEIQEQVELDSNEIKKMYRVAGRAYDVSYLTVSNKTLAETIKEEVVNGSRTLEEIFETLGGSGDLPQKKVTFTNTTNDSIHRFMFADTVSKNALLGPIEFERGKYMVIRVDNWAEKLALSDKQAKERMKQVRDKLQERYGIRMFHRYIRTLMKGKSAVFVDDTFRKLAEAYASYYLDTNEEKQRLFKREIFDDQREKAVQVDFYSRIEEILNHPLVTFDETTWTVRDFREAEASHPLVFRKRRFEGDFVEQFRYAVVDLIRDQYVTEDAYQKRYDQEPQVQEVYHMWKDNLLAQFARGEYLKTQGVTGGKPLDIIENHLNDYIASLQQKYSNSIEIDTDKFNELQLTRIDLFVTQKNVPYPIVVPSFPELTTRHTLDYGKVFKGKRLYSVKNDTLSSSAAIE